MKKKTVTLILASTAILSFFTGWKTRGTYEEIFPMEGHIHVISQLEGERLIRLEFPSGEKRRMKLEEHQSEDLVVHNTGEGSIAVFVEEKQIDKVGYVTSINNPIVLYIKEDTVGFSQIFRH